MPTPDPKPAEPQPDLVALVGDLLFGNFLGQAIVAAVALAFLGWLIKPIRHVVGKGFRALSEALRDVRVTRHSTIANEIKAAVASAEAKVRRELAPPSIAEITEEELAIIAENTRHAQSTDDQWVIMTNRSRRLGYVLQNYAARRATNVRLSVGLGQFEFGGPHRWDVIEEGESVPFLGRVSDPETFSALSRRIKVAWTDDHGDERAREIRVDRTDSLAI